MKVGGLAYVVVLTACGSVDSSHHADRPDGAALDAPRIIDGAPAAACDPSQPFTFIHDTQFQAASYGESNVSLSHDELAAYFTSNRVVGDGQDVFVATRANRNDSFATAIKLSTLDTAMDEQDPSLTADGLTIAFSRVTSGTTTLLYLATRPNVASSFGTPTELIDVENPTELNVSPALSADGLTLYFAQRPATGINQLVRTTRATLADPFGTPTPIDDLNMVGVSTSDPALRADGLMMYFASDRPGGMPGSTDIWVTTRASTSDAWGTPTNVTELDTPDYDWPTWVSDDGCQLYYSNNSDADAVWLATRPPIGS